MSRLFKNLPSPCYFTRWSEDQVYYRQEDGKVKGESFHPEDLCRLAYGIGSQTPNPMQGPSSVQGIVDGSPTS